MFGQNDPKKRELSIEDWINHIYELIQKYPSDFRLGMASRFLENALKNQLSPAASKYIDKNGSALATDLVFFAFKIKLDKGSSDSDSFLQKRIEKYIPALTSDQKVILSLAFHNEVLRSLLMEGQSCGTSLVLYKGIEKLVESFSKEQLSELEVKQDSSSNSNQSPGDAWLWKMISHLDKGSCIAIAEGVHQKLMHDAPSATPGLIQSS